MSGSLSNLREKIDAIDNQIVDLLKARLDIVKEVGKLKHQSGQKGSFIRSGREAGMLRNLTQRMSGVFPPEAIATIWRMIISTSLSVEQHMSVAAYVSAGDMTCYWRAREYFGTFLPVTQESSPEQIIRDVSHNKVTVGILPLFDSSEHPWWVRPQDEKNDLYVFACIPFISENNVPAKPVLAIANVVPEETGEDESVLAISTSSGKTVLEDVLKSAGFSPRLLGHEGEHYLYVVDGFVVIGDLRLLDAEKRLLPGSKIRLLGSYASPIGLRRK